MGLFINDSLSQQIFREELWVGSQTFTTDPGTTKELLIRVGASECVFSLSLIFNGSVAVNLLEGVSVSAAGAAITNINMRRSSVETLLTTTFHGATTTGGTNIFSSFSARDGRIAEASPFQADNGMILNANTDYKLSALVQGPAPQQFVFSWFLREEGL